jgi:hypothetical protein
MKKGLVCQLNLLTAGQVRLAGEDSCRKLLANVLQMEIRLTMKKKPDAAGGALDHPPAEKRDGPAGGEGRQGRPGQGRQGKDQPRQTKGRDEKVPFNNPFAAVFGKK